MPGGAGTQERPGPIAIPGCNKGGVTQHRMQPIQKLGFLLLVRGRKGMDPCPIRCNGDPGRGIEPLQMPGQFAVALALLPQGGNRPFDPGLVEAVEIMQAPCRIGIEGGGQSQGNHRPLGQA